MEILEEEGIRARLIRPITLFPFPYDAVYDASMKVKFVLCAELSTGQMVEDVMLAVKDHRPVFFYGRQGGMLVSPEEIVREVKKLRQKIMEG